MERPEGNKEEKSINANDARKGHMRGCISQSLKNLDFRCFVDRKENAENTEEDN